MPAFTYTSGNPNNLVGGQPASMADIQGPFTDLATFLNNRIAAIPTLVSSLPASPVDGQEIYYLADSTNGIVWHLRYRLASASASKWEFVGGSHLHALVAASEGTSLTSFADLGTVGPSITVPLAGDYDIGYGAQIAPPATSAVTGLMSIAVGGTGAVDADAVVVQTPSAGNAAGSPWRTVRKTGVAASAAVTAKYRTTNGTTNFSARTLRVTPVRVG